MNTVKIAELIEDSIIESVVEKLEKIMTVTDFGIQLDGSNKQVYRTHLSINFNVVQDTPVDKCRGADNPVEGRKMSDRDRLTVMACELLGINNRM